MKAYVIGATDAQDLALEAISEACRGQLAPFKIPRFIEFVSEFPMTAGSGKVSKGTLRTSKPDVRGGFLRPVGRRLAA